MQIAVIEGDDAAPEAMRPSVELLEFLNTRLNLGLEWVYPDIGEQAKIQYGTTFPDDAKQIIDESDATFFGSTSGSASKALFYLRWGKETYANVRPCRYLTGARSPLAHPEGIDFVIVRENLEDMYIGIEGELVDLAGLNLQSRSTRKPVGDLGDGRFAIKAITQAGTERIVRYAFELAQRRAQERHQAPVLTCTTKYNMLAKSDGYFLEIARELTTDYPDVGFNSFIIDDFACRIITQPQSFDVVVMPNLYGDIMSDAAAGLVGGLGLAASGCFGDGYAYFESAHGTAPDIQGQNIINPTATLLSGVMMLNHLGHHSAADLLDEAIVKTYEDGLQLTPDQGGNASTTQFCEAVRDRLEPRKL